MRKMAVIGVVVVGLLAAADAFGSRPLPRPSKLTRHEAESALQALPYRYEIRKVKAPVGASAAFAGEVHGPDKTYFQFGVSLGRHARAVSLPRSGTGHATFVPSAGFTFDTDLIIETAPNEYHYAPNIRTMRQLDIAAKMEADMEEALCIAATGEVCGF